MATIAYVTGQATALGANGGTTAALDTTGCKLLVVSAGFWAGGAGPETFSDSAGNSWTEIHDQSFSNTGLQWYYCLAPTTSAAHTFTYTSANSYTTLHVLGYSATIGFTYDQKATNQGNVATIQPGSLTPAQPDSLLIANQCFDVASAQAIDSSFTERYDSILVPGTNMGLQSSDLILPAPAATNPTMSGGGAVDRTAAMAVFYETPFSYTEREPLVIEDGVIEQLQSDSKLTDVVYADAASLTPDNAVVRVDGTRKEVQTSTALLADTGALTLAQNASLETSGAHTGALVINDSAGAVSFQVTAHTAASDNVGLGQGTLIVVTTGENNVCVGRDAGRDVTEGNNNTCMGVQAGGNITEGTYNACLGTYSGVTLTTGDNNTCFGGAAGYGLSTGDDNVAIGYSSLYTTTTTTQAVAIGRSAGRSVTSGSQNVFLGYYSGFHASQLVNPTNSIAIGASTYTTADNQVVIGNASITLTDLQSKVSIHQKAAEETSGAHTAALEFIDSAGNPSWDMRALLATSYSIGIGIGCLQDLTTGQYNFCLGYHAGFAITEGNSNICIGNGAGQAGTTMSNNTLVGVNCGRSLTLLTGSQNSAYGLGSLQTATTAVYNTASGYNSLYGLTQGGYNVGLGGQAGRTITTGSQNVFVGYGSGYHASQLATPTNSIGIGYGVYTTASNQVVIGNSSIAETLLQSEVRVQQKATEETSGAHTPALTIYDSAGEEVFAVGAHTLVSENFCMGPNAGTAITSGQYNTCIGLNAGEVLDTGSSNFFLGKDAGQNMTSGGNNVGIGRGALDNTDDANYNVAIGSFACNANVNDANVAIGYASMLVATGSANMCLGQNAGRTLSTGSNNIFIGDAAGHTGQLGTATESIVIGKSLVSTADYQIKIGTANHLTTEIAGGNIVLNCFDTNSIATATRSAILGGYSNTISQTAVGCCIPFGYSNNISGGWGHSFCYAGGYNCHITATTATSDYSAILSGTSNAVTSSTVSTIAGGSTNTITGASNYSAIGGGTLNDIADSLYATVCGGGNNNITATTDSSSIVGGNANNITASSYAFIGGGLQNGIISASNYSTVAGGRSNSISASVYATIGGGYDNDITGSVNATILGGGSNNISGSAGYSIAGGRENNITAAYAVATGYQGEAINMGQRSHAVGYFAADGDAQHTDLVMRRQTTDATPRASLIDGASTSVVMPDNTAWTIHALTVAQLSDGSEAAAYEHKALINKDGAANPAVVGSVTKTVIAESTAAWDCSLSVSGANPRMVYTGENAHTINWVTTWRIAQVSVAS